MFRIKINDTADRFADCENDLLFGQLEASLSIIADPYLVFMPTSHKRVQVCCQRIL